MPKQRLDQLLVVCGLVETRSKAQALIMAGKVRVGGQPANKPGQMLPETSEITLLEKEHPWVSRGGMKLAKGLDIFPVKPEGLTCLDIGASTGGFTDVLLHHGAARVYAVDVGHGQLDWRLRNDKRVVVMEKTNARYLTRETIPEPVHLITCDASFISLKTILPAAMALGTADASLIALIKPQFEAGREQVGKGGVVRDKIVHTDVCNTISNWLTNDMGWQVHGTEPGPITGPKGNKEFLIYASRRA